MLPLDRAARLTETWLGIGVTTKMVLIPVLGLQLQRLRFHRSGMWSRHQDPSQSTSQSLSRNRAAE